MIEHEGLILIGKEDFYILRLLFVVCKIAFHVGQTKTSVKNPT